MTEDHKRGDLRLKTAQVDSVDVAELGRLGSLKSGCWQDWLHLETLRETLVHGCLLVMVAASYPWSPLACSHITQFVPLSSRDVFPCVF